MKQNTFAVVLPYFNELNFIRPTLESCLAQKRLPDQLILVDNASTDGSEQLCREVLRAAPPEMEIVYVHEAKPGYVHAVNAGVRRVTSEFTAIWNADTTYPPHYFAECERLLADAPHVVAAMAKDVAAAPRESWSSRVVLWTYYLLSQLRPKMGFTGGYGHVFRTAVLRSSGGYSLDIWPYAMDDHEILNRVCRAGRLRYSPNHWCLTSDRRQDRRKTSWNFVERIVYFLTPARMGDWYFYRFLGPRLKQRKILLANLRQRDWEKNAKTPPGNAQAA